jgi:hypothetical protein
MATITTSNNMAGLLNRLKQSNNMAGLLKRLKQSNNMAEDSLIILHIELYEAYILLYIAIQMSKTYLEQSDNNTIGTRARMIF